MGFNSGLKGLNQISKPLPVYTIKKYRNRRIATLILNLSTKWR
jgi:hypothetical protein